LSVILKYLPRARQVLRTEGLPVLVAKLLRRLRTTPLSVKQNPDLLTLHPPSEPFGFPVVPMVDVSIVIPVFNQYRFTFHCLAALRRQRSAFGFEVLVVDDGSTDETRAQLSRFGNLRLIVNSRNRGFVRSCNAGAHQARGRYIVFLNNDTQVQPGWLDALIGTFRRHSQAGVVGSRLLFPDGRQQEAGAIVFRDGSSWNYGHLDDPYKPRYSYVREPDYVSGASLAIRRDLFEQLGGFDEHFAPAYYEDVDLAFRIRAAGYRVLYAPLSRVVHCEGVSAGTNETAAMGMKRFQVINREKFVARWRGELAAHGARGEELERQKERRIRRRVFVSDVYMLTPDRESGSLRMQNLCVVLQALGFKITFAASNLEAPQPYVSDLQQRGVEVLYRPYISSIDRHLQAHGADYDLVILSRADTAAQLMAGVRRHCRQARIVFDTVDLHFLRERRLAELTGDKAIRAAAERRRREELELIAQADTTLVVSHVERDLLAREVPTADVQVLSNVHRIHGSRNAFAHRQDILFIGAFAHPPNRDAVLWFCREIFPLVSAEEPELRLVVIGADPPPEVRDLAAANVRILGYVPDVAPFFDDCRLSVAPLRYGAGVKGKINQSLAFGLPVVATPQAVEGMFLKDRESILIADKPTEFAAAVLRLYGDHSLWERLSRNGLAVMEAHFSFAAARRALMDLVEHGKNKPEPAG